MSASVSLARQLCAAIDDHIAATEHAAVLAALDAAERACRDVEALDGFIGAVTALWDVPLGVAGARILEALNHLAFGDEAQAAAVLAGLQEGAGT